MFGWFKNTPKKLDEQRRMEDYRVYVEWFSIAGSPKPLFHTNNSGWSISQYRFYRCGDYFRVTWGWTVLHGKYIPPANEYHIQRTMIEYILEQLPQDAVDAYHKRYPSHEPPYPPAWS